MLETIDASNTLSKNSITILRKLQNETGTKAIMPSNYQIQKLINKYEELCNNLIPYTHIGNVAYLDPEIAVKLIVEASYKPGSGESMEIIK